MFLVSKFQSLSLYHSVAPTFFFFEKLSLRSSMYSPTHDIPASAFWAQQLDIKFYLKFTYLQLCVLQIPGRIDPHILCNLPDG